jgi:SNF2 family DNA or RNA helicase
MLAYISVVCVSHHDICIHNIGTPIQNNLEELFAVVQFTSPGYLGSLQEFKKAYSDPIDKGRDPNASKKLIDEGTKATTALRLRMSHILLRRTRDVVLQAILPPRRDYLLHCDMSAPQRDQYIQECGLLFESLNENNYRREKNSMVAKNSTDSDDNDSDGDVDDSEIIDSDDNKSEKKHKDNMLNIKNVNKKGGSKLNGRKGMKAFLIGKGVLPNIMQLRQICDFATWDVDVDSHEAQASQSSHSSCTIVNEGKENIQLVNSNYSSNGNSSEGSRKEEEKEMQYLKRRQSTERYVNKLLQHSGKLKVKVTHKGILKHKI